MDANSSAGSVNMAAILSALNDKLDSLASDVATLHARDSQPPPPVNQPSSQQSTPKPHMKLEITIVSPSHLSTWMVLLLVGFNG
ncbi:hypothetical protein A2U01_0012549 [Trifolium medium]|uniref:Uncharacterized protein n=1 Tax=Trifolium medium TaxID=97028 RepID=A0A392MVV7_9FABA|nr:hypothetical protein [Trifolium medium]